MPFAFASHGNRGWINELGRKDHPTPCLNRCFTIFVPHLQVEEALVLALMRLREKMGLKPSRRNRASASEGSGKPSHRSNADIGRYTQDLWKSLGAPEPEAGDGREDARGPVEADNNPYWGRDARARLVAFAETLRAGESALSPAVFDAEGGRRAQVTEKSSSTQTNAVYFVASLVRPGANVPESSPGATQPEWDFES